MRNWLLPAATGIAGLVAGLLIADYRAEPQGSAVVFPRVVADPVGTQPAQDPVTLDDLRRVVREELAAVPARAGATVAGGSAAEIPAPTGEQVAAATQARAVLDSALSRRTWSDADREALAQQSVLMTAAQRDEWLQQFAQAVNQGRLVPESELPPL